MRYLLALVLTCPLAAFGQTPTDDLLKGPCIEMVEGAMRAEIGEVLITRGIEGVADSHFGSGVLMGFFLGYAAALGTDPGEGHEIGFQLGRLCSENPDLSLVEALNRIAR